MIDKLDLSKYKVLHLTLTKKAFEVMATGEKSIEYRKPTKWLMSRLYCKCGARKQYDFIKFTLGYGNDKPYFISYYTQFLGFTISGSKYSKVFSNGLKVDVIENDYLLNVGEIVEIGNYKIKEVENE